MTQTRKDKGKEKEEMQSDSRSADVDKSSSTTSISSNEETKKCMDAVDFFTRKTKAIVIGKDKKSETKTGKSNKRAPAAAGKRRKRAHGGIKRSISLRSGLNEIGMGFDSGSEPTSADVVGRKELKGKRKEQEESDVFQGSDTDSEEACKRMKKERHNDDENDDTDDNDGAGSGAQTNLSSLGLQVAGK